MDEVKATVNQVLQILKDPAYKQATAERRQKLREIIGSHFDFRNMARSALGYHWKDLSSAQRDNFVTIFTNLMEASYMGKIEAYNNQKIKFVKERVDGPMAEVRTNILSTGSDPIRVNYLLKLENSDWKVYDVAVDDVRLVDNYRTQFNRIINAKGYDALVQEIKVKQQQIDSSN